MRPVFGGPLCFLFCWIMIAGVLVLAVSHLAISVLCTAAQPGACSTGQGGGAGRAG